MEQPPQQPQGISISPSQLVQESKRKESYLSVLPTDVIRMLLAYTSIEGAIHDMRETPYLKELQKRIDKSLSWGSSDQERVNVFREAKEIVDTLFAAYQPKGIDKFTIALMLNLYPSFRIAFGLPPELAMIDWLKIHPSLKSLFGSEPPPAGITWETMSDIDKELALQDQYLDAARVFGILARYIKAHELNYQSLVAYVQQFIYNYERYHQEGARFTITHYGQDKIDREKKKILALLLDLYENELKNGKQLSELKVLLDTRQYYFAKELLCSGSSDLLKNPIVIRYLNKRNMSNTTAHALQFQQEFMQAWIDAFKEYLEQKNAQAAWMFNVYMYNCPNALFKKMLIEKAGAQLLRYSLGKYPLRLSDGDFDEVFYVDLLEYLFKHDPEITLFALKNSKIINWLKEKLHSDPSSSIAQERDLQYAIRLLIALMQSPSLDVATIKELLDIKDIKKLLNSDLIINVADDEGITLLMHAIQNARFDISNFLLDQLNIKINSCDNNGHTALSFAGLLPESPERDALIKRLKDMGAQQEGVCAIQ